MSKSLIVVTNEEGTFMVFAVLEKAADVPGDWQHMKAWLADRDMKVERWVIHEAPNLAGIVSKVDVELDSIEQTANITGREESLRS